MLDQQQLTAYREAATAAKERMSAIPLFIVLPQFIENDIPTLATAVVELCAEVERLQKELERPCPHDLAKMFADSCGRDSIEGDA